MEKTCFDCSYFFPATLEGPSEFGICANDEVFDPVIDDLIEYPSSASCRALVEEKKFSGDALACPDFEQSEIIEIDDDSPLGRELRRLAENDQLSPEALENLILLEELDRIDWKTVPVDDLVKQLESIRPEDRHTAIGSLGSFIALGNQAAFEALVRFMGGLPPVRKIDEVHLKIRILRLLAPWRDRTAIVPHLVEELYRTPSNNTTRQWISAIFRFLAHCPLEAIQQPLEEIASDKRFSHRLRKKAEAALAGAAESAWLR